MITAKISDGVFSKIKRLKDLPQYVVGAIAGIRKKHAIMFVKNFRNGIMQRTLRMTPLKPSTIAGKKRMGYKTPSTPLAGAGLDIDDRTYANMMRIHTVKNGYVVRPSRMKHHKADLTLRQLFYIHETGRTIRTKNAIIRIPPRPAGYKAYRKTIIEIQGNRVDTAKLRKACKDYVYNARLSTFNEMKRQKELGKEFEGRD